MVAAIYNVIGVIHRKKGNYDTADEFHQKVLEILQSSVGSDHPHVAAEFFEIGLLEVERQNYSLAEDNFRLALDIRSRRLGPEHPKVADVLDKYAELLRDLDRSSEAEQLELRSEAIRKTVNDDQ